MPTLLGSCGTGPHVLDVSGTVSIPCQFWELESFGDIGAFKGLCIYRSERVELRRHPSKISNDPGFQVERWMHLLHGCSVQVQVAGERNNEKTPF